MCGMFMNRISADIEPKCIGMKFQIPFIAIALGTVVVLTSAFQLFGSSQNIVQIGVMISGSIVLGSGIIAAAILSQKE